VHIGICAGGCNAGDGPKDKQDVQLFLAETLRPDFRITESMILFQVTAAQLCETTGFRAVVKPVVFSTVRFSVLSKPFTALNDSMRLDLEKFPRGRKKAQNWVLQSGISVLVGARSNPPLLRLDGHAQK
jgi:hypothetical protein